MGDRVTVRLVSNRLGNRRLVYAGLAMAAVGVALLVASDLVSLNLARLLLLGLGCTSVYPGLMYETPLRFDAHTARKVIGWQVGTACLGTAIMPAAFGLLAAHLRLKAIFRSSRPASSS